MTDRTQQVLDSKRLWHVEEADAIGFLDGLPANSIALVMASPPYEAQRTYGIDFKLRGQAWVDWMLAVFAAARRVCRGPVVMVVEGCTKDYRWSATPALLMADLHRAGFCLRKPPIYRRIGIPGSGGQDWWRNDYEFCIVTTRGGKLPWSDNTACGHVPKYGPGGKPSHRTQDGNRVNGGVYVPPKLANPGNIIDCKVGGGRLGSPLAHESEGPYPQSLCERFVRSYCPPGGVVLDCFAGSGTTLAVAIQHGRRALGCDIRDSQVKLTARRLAGEKALFDAEILQSTAKVQQANAQAAKKVSPLL